MIIWFSKVKQKQQECKSKELFTKSHSPWTIIDGPLIMVV